MSTENWSSRIAFYFVSIGAAVGLGTMWRFPYLAGQYGGGFIIVFVVVCILITAPILAAEFMLGRSGRGSPPAATRKVAIEASRSPRWSIIGWLGTLAMFLIMAYYSVIGGWVFEYVGSFAIGTFSGLDAVDVEIRFAALLAHPWALAFWHFIFMAATVMISASGLQRGIELANKIMIPGLFTLLLVLVVYAFVTGDLEKGVPFIFRVEWSQVDADLILAAVGQAFYATGVGMAIMIAYGSYVPREVSLLKSGAVISGSIIIASILASLIIFPLAFRYGIDPAQGPQLAFVVLPTIFADMPGGQIMGFAFFVLLAFAALSSALAGLEPSATVFQERFSMSRRAAVGAAGGAMWLAGIPIVLSFNVWSQVRPLAGIPRYEDYGIFKVTDYTSANVLLPIGAFLTCLFVAWRLPNSALQDQFGLSGWRLRTYRWILGGVCPLAILMLFLMNL